MLFNDRRFLRTICAWLAAWYFATLGGVAYANPQGGSIVAGSATIDQSVAARTTVKQMTDKVIIDWRSFSNSSGETIRFAQPSTSAAALNRVTGNETSVIQGALQSNGNVFLINPNGVVFSKTARVDVGGLVASSLDMSNADFMQGRYILQQRAGAPAAAVINRGTITARPGGRVALVAPVVSNEGTITAPGGMVGLAAGTSAEVSLDGANLVSVRVPAGVARDVLVGKADADAILDHVVNRDGMTQATSVAVVNGQVVLRAAEGTAIQAGKIDVSAPAGGRSGSVTLASSRNTIVAPGSITLANGTGLASSGGTVRALSHGDTLFAQNARIEARGGTTGDGGLVEISGHRVKVQGTADTRATSGKNGTLLIDPVVLEVVDGPSGAGTVDGTDNGWVQFSSGGCSSSISVGEIAQQSTLGDVVLQATGEIHLANTQDIVLAPASGFYLETDGTAGTGDIKATTATPGAIRTTGGYVTLHAAGAIDLTRVTISTAGGAIDLTGMGSVQFAQLLADTGTVNITSLSANVDATQNGLNVTGSTARFTAGGSVGSTRGITVNAGTLAGAASGGDFNVLVQGDVALADIHAQNAVTIASATGSILNDRDTSTLIDAQTLTLAAANGVGATGPAGGIDTDVTHFSAVAGAGGVHINEQDFFYADKISLDSIATSGALEVTSASGIVVAGPVVAGDKLTLRALAGSIDHPDALGTHTIDAGSAELHATAGIGTIAPLVLRTPSLSAYNEGTGDIAIAGGVSGGGNVNVNTLVDTGGSVKLTVADGKLTLLGFVSPSKDVSLATMAGAKRIAGDIELTGFVQATGDVMIQSAGNLRAGLITGNAVNLTAAGSITDGNGDAMNVIAANGSRLAANGTIGLVTDPFDVNVTGAASVQSNGVANGVSVDIRGIVSPANKLLVVGTPPGLVLFNQAPPTPPPPPSGKEPKDNKKTPQSTPPPPPPKSPKSLPLPLPLPTIVTVPAKLPGEPQEVARVLVTVLEQMKKKLGDGTERKELPDPLITVIDK